MTTEELLDKILQKIDEIEAFFNTPSVKDVLPPASFINAADSMSKKYRDTREEYGLKDPVTLNEIEEAYYTGMLQGFASAAYQGETHETEIVLHTTQDKKDIPAIRMLLDDSYKKGDRVVVQVIKKDNYEKDNRN